MRADLLNQIGDLRDVTNAILLTHNIDFIFLQSVVMSYLRRCGDPTLTILADADCAAASYRAQHELLDSMGTRYRVVPIRMQPGFVFHPKALLLTGPQQATLYVGSGNLTFGGWRQNGEVWSRYSVIEDGRTAFEEFRTYVTALLAGVPLAGSILSEVEDAYDPRTKLWTSTAPPGESALLGRVSGEAALLDTMAAAFGPEAIDELVVCSPYYDGDGNALAALRARLPHQKSMLLHPGKGSTLTAQAWARAGNGMSRRPCAIHHPHAIENRPAFVHAKFYAAIRGDQAVVIQGSANCSRAALLVDGLRGNAELMTVLRISADDFRRDWLDTLTETAEFELAAATDIEKDDAPPALTLQILAARAEDGVILVAYHPPVAEINACSIDGKAVPFTTLQPGQVHIPHFGTALALVIEGDIEGTRTATTPHWVDQENRLGATARRRRLEETIPRTLGGEKWTSDQWIELLQALDEHLKYTPARARNTAQSPRLPDTESTATRRYEDIFAQHYSPDTMLSHWKDEMPPTGEAHDSVRKLLMRWLGIGQGQAAAAGEPDTPAAGVSRGEGDQPEDTPPRPQSTKVPSQSIGLTDGMREKLRRILADIEETVTDSEYLESRPPDFLRSDMMMMSVILRFGYARDWLSHEAFFAFTHKVWATLFLSSSKDPQVGWLEWRRTNAPDPQVYTAAFTSPQLSAALITWALIGLDAPPSIERARFILAQALSAARMPELWFGGSMEDIAHELANVLHASNQPIDPERLVTIWREPLAQGVALRKLGERLEFLGLERVRRAISAPSVVAGDLLWQGRAGYCVAVEPGSRETTSAIKTLKLQLGGTGYFQGRMTLPVRAMLATEEVGRALGEQHLSAIGELLSHLAFNLVERKLG